MIRHQYLPSLLPLSSTKIASRNPHAHEEAAVAKLVYSSGEGGAVGSCAPLRSPCGFVIPTPMKRLRSPNSCIVVARVARWGRVGPCGRHVGSASLRAGSSCGLQTRV